MKPSALLLLLAAMPLASAKADKPLVLLELFTSQSCYSCPAAEKLMAEHYLDHPDVLALELHVDYWDDLVYRGSAWKDLFSSPQFTQRQLGYTQTTRRNAFTPQMVIQGAFSASGARRNGIEHGIKKARELKFAEGWDLSFDDAGGSWRASVTGSSGSADAIAVVYLERAETAIGGGENKGKKLVNHNVVVRFEPQPEISQGAVVEIGAVGPGERCAVILQRAGQGVVLGVWPCPQPAAG